eukprot:1644253-Amphidinium_carterae.1
MFFRDICKDPMALPHCASKWTSGKSAPERWIIFCKGSNDTTSSHFTWGDFNDEWCEHAIQWLRKVRLATELEKVKDKIDLIGVITALNENKRELKWAWRPEAVSLKLSTKP